MSVDEIDSFVVLFPDGQWAVGEERREEVLQLHPDVSFAQEIEHNIQVLSTSSADRGLGVRGLLYVPDVDEGSACYNKTSPYIPRNATRRSNLPPTDFTLIALAPWVHPECTLQFMEAAWQTTTRAFIFYLPTNDTTTPSSDSSDWDLGDGGAWKHTYNYPVYGIPGRAGGLLMSQLSAYSGSMMDVPNGRQIASIPGIDTRDYVRIYTKIGGTHPTVFPSIWIFLLLVAGAMALLLLIISASMHLIQRRRRQSLRRRVANGEVNLEALGIKRLSVPPEYITKLPLFVYSGDGEVPPTESNEKSIVAIDDGTTSQHPSHTFKSTTSWAFNPPPFTIIRDHSNPEYHFFHQFLPYPQPTCIICLDDFEIDVSTIRELPCGHIFHPECIDTYLGNSSLCPLCKQSALPPGYCPKITGAMVRRELNVRRLRSRVSVNARSGEVEPHDPKRALWELVVRVGKATFSTGRRDLEDMEDNMIYERTQTVFNQYCVTAAAETLVPTMTREEIVERRVRELVDGQTPIIDPDLPAAKRHHQRWKRSISKAFPGYE